MPALCYHHHAVGGKGVTGPVLLELAILQHRFNACTGYAITFTITKTFADAIMVGCRAIVRVLKTGAAGCHAGVISGFGYLCGSCQLSSVRRICSKNRLCIGDTDNWRFTGSVDEKLPLTPPSATGNVKRVIVPNSSKLILSSLSTGRFRLGSRVVLIWLAPAAMPVSEEAVRHRSASRCSLVIDATRTGSLRDLATGDLHFRAAWPLLRWATVCRYATIHQLILYGFHATVIAGSPAQTGLENNGKQNWEKRHRLRAKVVNRCLCAG